MKMDASRCVSLVSVLMFHGCSTEGSSSGGASDVATDGGPGSMEAGATDSPNDTGTLYLSADRCDFETLDGYVVRDAKRGRDIPVYVRAPLNTTGPLPIVVWSHGGGSDPPTNPSSRFGSRDWGDALAGACYVTVSPSHLQDDGPAICAKLGGSSAECAKLRPSFDAEYDRPLDLSSVIDDLDGIEANFPSLKGRLDRTRMAVGGHSFGSYGPMVLAGGTPTLLPSQGKWNVADARPRAFLTLSPQGPGRFGWLDGAWERVNKPIFVGTGDGDCSNNEQAPDRRVGFDQMPAGEKYRMVIGSTGAVHATFNLNKCGVPYTFSCGACKPELETPFQDWVRSAGIAFLDAYVKGYPAGLSWIRSTSLATVSAGVARIDTK